MRDYTALHVPYQDYHPLQIILRDESNKLLGAALGEAGRHWLKISVIWVDEHLRGQGYGTQLLAAIESQAIQHDCQQAFLDTFSYQARPFYEKAGYEVFGTLDDYPPGHKRFFMKKRLAS
jgi:GNAT superfamily N-acetyltransferase